MPTTGNGLCPWGSSIEPLECAGAIAAPSDSREFDVCIRAIPVLSASLDGRPVATDRARGAGSGSERQGCYLS